MGDELLDVTGLSREDAVAIHRLRLNRFPALQATKARWQRDGADTATCRRCGRGDGDTLYFLTACPALTPLRQRILGSHPSVGMLQSSHRAVIKFLLFFHLYVSSQ